MVLKALLFQKRTFKMPYIPIAEARGFTANLVREENWIELAYDGIGRATASWHPNVIGQAMESHNGNGVGTITVLMK